jgi:hypothetical protein
VARGRDGGQRAGAELGQQRDDQVEQAQEGRRDRPGEPLPRRLRGHRRAHLA